MVGWRHPIIMVDTVLTRPRGSQTTTSRSHHRIEKTKTAQVSQPAAVFSCACCQTDEQTSFSFFSSRGRGRPKHCPRLIRVIAAHRASLACVECRHEHGSWSSSMKPLSVMAILTVVMQATPASAVLLTAELPVPFVGEG